MNALFFDPLTLTLSRRERGSKMLAVSRREKGSKEALGVIASRLYI
jgi:hypothetical protein